MASFAKARTTGVEATRSTQLILLAGALWTSCHAATAADGSASAASSTGTVARQPPREEIFERARKRKGGKEPTQLDLLNELMRKGQEQAGAMVDHGKPRVVLRGNKPDIVLKGTDVVIDGKSLSVGTDEIAEWRTVLGKEDRREIASGDVYLWDKLGIGLITVTNGSRVIQLDIVMNREPPEPWYGQMPDGSIRRPRPDYRSKTAFPGYLALDGYGIDSRTMFWEIRASADPQRNLRCSSRDCSHPHGGFSEFASIYMRLNSATEYGNVYEFTIGGASDRVSSVPARPVKTR